MRRVATFALVGGLAGALAGAVAGSVPPLLAAPAAAAVPAALSVSGMQPAPGVVRFLLTARGLPVNTALDPAGVSASTGGTPLAVAAQHVSSSAAANLPPRALVVVLDVSGSVAGARLAGARVAARELAADLPGDVRLGLIAVSGAPRVLLAPTADRAAFVSALDKLTARGDTALYDGVRLGLSTMQGAGFGPGSDRRELVLSDGGDNASTTPRSALLAELTAAKLPVDVVAFQADALGTANMTAMAGAAGGHVLTANASSLTAAFRTAAGSFSEVLAVQARVPDRFAGRHGQLTVSVRLATGTLTAVVPVTFGPPVAGPPPMPVAAVGSWLSTPVMWGIVGVVFASLLVLVMVLAWPRRDARGRVEQIGRFGPARFSPTPVPPAGNGGTALTRTLLDASASFVRSRNLEQRIGLGLEQAGMRVRPHEWLIIQAGAVFAGALLGLAVLGLAGLPLGGLAGWLVTRLYRGVRTDQRTRRFADQLPDALQLVTGSLRSGFSLGQSLDSVVREAPAPISDEFGRALAEHRLGSDLADALARVADRTRNEDLMWVVMAVRIQREVGGNLAEVLSTAVDTMRERGRLRRHVRALSAEGRLSAWILVGLPLLLAAFMFTFRYAYMRPLITNPIGILMLVIGAVLMVVGIFWMTRVVRVEA